MKTEKNYQNDLGISSLILFIIGVVILGLGSLLYLSYFC